MDFCTCWGKPLNKLHVVKDVMAWKKRNTRSVSCTLQLKNAVCLLVDTLIDNRWSDNKKLWFIDMFSKGFSSGVSDPGSILCPKTSFRVRSLEDRCSLNYPAAAVGAAWFQRLQRCVIDKPICARLPLYGQAMQLNQARNCTCLETSVYLMDHTGVNVFVPLQIFININHFPIDFCPFRRLLVSLCVSISAGCVVIDA